MLTSRFISFPIKIYDKKAAEMMGIEPEYVDSYMKINPLNISAYNPVSDGITNIYLKSGTTVYIYLNIDDFEKLLNSLD